MDPHLISATQMFLVPVTIFFAALGVANTEPLKTGISFLGVTTTSAWLIRVLLWKSGLKEEDFWIIAFLSILFLCVWTLSLATHLVLWLEERRAEERLRGLLRYR